MDGRFLRYLFESHSEETLRAWAKRLRLFRFFRAYGGHANDGDSLDVAYRYGSTAELRSFFEFVGVPLVAYEAMPPQPEPGKSYPGDEFARFPSLIPGTQWIAQPKHCDVGSHRVFIWCERGQIKLSVGTDYQVTERDVAAAELVEQRLLGAPLERVDPAFDTINYVCPKYYPEYFED